MAPPPDAEQRVKSTKEHMANIQGPRFNIWASQFENSRLDDAIVTADSAGARKAIVWGMSDLIPFDPRQAEEAKAFFKALGAHNGPGNPIPTVPELLQAMVGRKLPSFQVRPESDLQRTTMETPDGPALYYRMSDTPGKDIEIEALQLGTKIPGVSILLTGPILQGNGEIKEGKYLNASLVISMS